MSAVRTGRLAPAGVLAAGAAAALVAVGWFDGGYFPSAWGWATLGFVLAAVLALGLRESLAIGRAEGLWLGALLLLSLWTVASMGWTEDLTRTVYESERVLVYLAAAAAVVFVVARPALPGLVAGLVAGATALATWALATRLFPERLGVFDPIAGYRLSEPVGYWNALGTLAAMGAALALALALRSRSTLARAAAAAPIPLLAATTYFTFSRGAWIALGLGLAAALLVSERRLQLALGGLALAAPAAAAVVLASRRDALTHVDAALADAAREGRSLAVALAVLAAVAAATAVGLALAERRLEVPAALRRATAAVLLLALASALVGVFARYGAPWSLARDAVEAFEAPPLKPGDDLERRLFSLSGNGRVELWKAGLEGYEANRRLGTGAGTYELHWHRYRPVGGQARDAHNIYLETLVELGPVGLGLLALALASPLVAVRRARRHPLFPGAFAAYVAFLAHATVDWDWEMPVVTLVALACGGAMLASARGETRGPLRFDARIALGSGAAAVGIAALVALVGNGALAESAAATEAQDWPRAIGQAERAERWAPWSADPWRARGEAELARGNARAAAASFRTAVEASPKDWSLWFALALATRGDEQRRALARAKSLSPLSPQVLELERVLARR